MLKHEEHATVINFLKNLNYCETAHMPRVSKGLFVGSFALIGALVGFYVQDKLLKELEQRGIF